MALGSTNQIRALAKAVSAAFAASALTEEEKSPSKVEMTDLPWAAPPLIVGDQMLDDAPLQDYLDTPLDVSEAPLVRFWTQTMEMMWERPGALLRKGTHATCARTMPDVRIAQRALRFSVPDGYPARLADTAGATFSLEVAHVARISLAISRVVEDDANYYVVLDDGTAVGIRNGRPACGGPWNYDVSGMVPDLLTMTRGVTHYECRFDQIASLRSVLHVHRARFPHNFEALDLALQTLRVLSLGGGCPDLVNQMYVAPMDAALLKAQERALRDAIELMPDPMSDRSKLRVLHAVLVPTVIPGTAFKKNIFSGPEYPFTLAAGKLAQIEKWLRQEYQSRIPADIQRLKDE